MINLEKIKTTAFKYKYYILGSVVFLVLIKLLLGNKNQQSSSTGEYMVTPQYNASSAPADNSMAILQSQQQFALSQQKLAFDNDSALADKQIAIKQMEVDYNKSMNDQSNLIAQQQLSSDRYIAEQNAKNQTLSLQNSMDIQQSQLLYQDKKATYDKELAEYNANMALQLQNSSNSFNEKIKMQELKNQEFVAKTQASYNMYVTDKQARAAKDVAKYNMYSGIIDSAFNLVGNAWTGGALGNVQSGAKVFNTWSS